MRFYLTSTNKYPNAAPTQHLPPLPSSSCPLARRRHNKSRIQIYTSRVILWAADHWQRSACMLQLGASQDMFIVLIQPSTLPKQVFSHLAYYVRHVRPVIGKSPTLPAGDAMIHVLVPVPDQGKIAYITGGLTPFVWAAAMCAATASTSTSSLL